MKGPWIITSVKPSRWREQVTAHVARATTNETRIRTQAVDTSELATAEANRVHAGIRRAVSAVVTAGARYDVISEIRLRVSRRCAQVAVAAAPVTAVIIRSPELSLLATVLGAVAAIAGTLLGVLLFVGAFLALAHVIRYESWLIPLVLSAVILRVAAIAGDEHTSAAWLPQVLKIGWIHLGLTGASWVFMVFAGVFAALMIIESWGLFGFQRRLTRHWPKQWLVYRLTQLIAEIPAALAKDDEVARRQHIENIETMARRFEHDWSVSGRTRFSHVEKAAREYACRVSAVVRAHEYEVRNQTVGLDDLRRPLSDVVIQLVTCGDFDDPPTQRAGLKAWWWKSVRVTIGVATLLAGLFSMAAAVSQPGFPNLLSALDLTGLSEWASLSDELRIGAGSLGVILIGQSARLLVPRSLAILLLPGAVPEGVETPRLT